MKKQLRLAAFLVIPILVAACVPPVRTDEPRSSSADEVETMVAMTLQALAPETSHTATSVPESSSRLFPQSLYFLSNDSQAVAQIFRMERDGKTKVQITFESTNVWDYDVSPATGRLAYEVNNQLILINADGSDRRVLLEGPPDPIARGFYKPVFSPDGGTLAYAHNGLNFYSVSTSTSNLVIEDKFEDVGNGQLLPIETYAPERYSPDGTKLLVALGHWEVLPSHAVYSPSTNSLIRYAEVEDYVYCCSFHGGPIWSPDNSSFYGVASVHDSAYQYGELWRVDAASGAVTRMLRPDPGTLNLPKEPYLAPDGQLYFFFGKYDNASGFFEPPVLELVRSAPDGETNRTVLRKDNFVLMQEALWAPDASFVIVVMAPGQDWDQGGVLQLYPTDRQKEVVWLAPLGWQMKWGP